MRTIMLLLKMFNDRLTELLEIVRQQGRPKER